MTQFNEASFIEAAKVVKAQFQEEAARDTRISETLSKLSAEEHELLLAAAVNRPRTFPRKQSWLGSPSEMAAALGAELEETEPNRTRFDANGQVRK